MSGDELGLWLFDWTEDRQSDFRLILASRELLQALENLLAVAPAKAPAAGLLVGIEDRHAKAIKAASDAIRKAKGK